MTNSSNPLIPSGHEAAPETIPFHLIRNEHFKPAFDWALGEAKSRVEKLKKAPASADFENTIEALEHSSEDVEYLNNVFSCLLHSETNPELQNLAREIMPELAKFSNDIYLDAELFARVKKVHDDLAGAALPAERRMLLDKTYKAFVRNGALLPAEKQVRLREIDSRMAVATQTFGDHVLKATQSFELVVTDQADLAGLPDTAIESAAMTAKEKGNEGAWVFTLDYPSFGPFLKFSERRDLREKMWRAYMTRATEGETDNRPLTLEIARLRHERANLLGYSTHAHFVMEERMAGTPDTVRTFLDRLRGVSRKAAEKDIEELRAFSGLQDFRPWDFAFYSEKLREKKFDLREEELRPYFKLENVIAGIFEHARRLYGVKFEKREGVPVYHPDVQVFEARDEKTGAQVGLFYADFHPRPSKQGGAWMMGLRDQGLFQGQVRRPHVGIVCNLTKPTASKPSLLDYNEVRTIFHEFGHALHGLLAQGTYRSLSGTNVYWDFVELPSQIMENWIREKESLDLFARHFQTGETIPESLVKKIRDAARFQAGYQSLRQLNFGYLDLSWHAQDPSPITDVETHEKKATRETSVFDPVPGTISSTGFTHIFSGGYSAGYYSYKWAEVLEADAFEFFLEKGIFNREVADRFRSHILSKGGSEHPMELYKRFRGREPDPDALLRRDGLI